MRALTINTHAYTTDGSTVENGVSKSAIQSVLRIEEQVRDRDERMSEFPVYSNRSSYNRAAPSYRKSKSAEEGDLTLDFLMAVLTFEFISGNKIYRKRSSIKKI